jgi:SAM-dependent methyltransferase
MEEGYVSPSRMSEPTSPNSERIAWWSGVAGDGWVAQEQAYDAMLAPVLDVLVAALDPRPGERVLDVGAGTGTLALELAERVGDTGRITAVDVSTPMLARAAQRIADAGVADRVRLLQADAQVHPFESARHDAVTSRFGVMFFEDPTAAFANLAGATRPGGRLAFACWQPMEHNEFIRLSASIAQEVVGGSAGPSPLGDPHSLGDPALVHVVLGDAGWADVDLAPVEGELHLGGPGSLDHALDFAVGRGTVRARLEGAGPEAAAEVRARLAEALGPRHDGPGVRVGYAAWLVTAHR